MVAARLASEHPAELLSCLREIVARIDIHPGHMTIGLNREKVLCLLGCDGDAEGDRDDARKSLAIDVPFVIKRRGVEARIVLGDSRSVSPCPNDNLITAIARAHGWFEQLTSGHATTAQEIATSEGLIRSDVSLALPLAFLAPDIVGAIVAGRQPADLTWERLKRAAPLPSCWHKQRRILGFSQPN